ncbi:uncharacterized protein LOC110117971 isoform X2 [Ceratitis capitata]|uniref:uncharacterized protein LOC110117971 isoform X2 n=1 Tax=Ceratitis capitata TaxID=7213 RepID=UPI000C6C87BE|nr:uncharacterized protein LOC110117971 isoform X2 [Ceratitis capitata]
MTTDLWALRRNVGSIEERRNLRQRDKSAAVRVILDKWVHRLKTLNTPGPRLTVDEELLPYRLRCPFAQFIPSKPHKYGNKHWILCRRSKSR